MGTRFYPSLLAFSSVRSRPKGFEMGRRWRRVDLAEKKVARRDWYPMGWHTPVMPGLRGRQEDWQFAGWRKEGRKEMSIVVNQRMP